MQGSDEEEEEEEAPGLHLLWPPPPSEGTTAGAPSGTGDAGTEDNGTGILTTPSGTVIMTNLAPLRYRHSGVPASTTSMDPNPDLDPDQDLDPDMEGYRTQPTSLTSIGADLGGLLQNGRGVRGTWSAHIKC